MPLTNPINGSRLLASRDTATTALTAADTVVLSGTLPANSLAVGHVFRVRYLGAYAATVAGTVSYRLRIGTAGTIADTQIVVATTAAGGTAAVSIAGEAWATVRTIGSSGTIIGAIHGRNPPANTDHGPLVQTTTVAVNTTVGNFISFTAGTSVATANITFHQVWIEQLRLSS